MTELGGFQGTHRGGDVRAMGWPRSHVPSPLSPAGPLAQELCCGHLSSPTLWLRGFFHPCIQACCWHRGAALSIASAGAGHRSTPGSSSRGSLCSLRGGCCSFFFFFGTFSSQYPSQASSVLTRELELGLEKPSSTKARRRGPRAESEARREAFPTRGEAAAPSPSSSCNCACTQLRRLPGKSY